MKPPMTKAEGQAWRERWQRVNAVCIDEARQATPEERLRGLEMLFEFAHSLGPRKDDDSVAEVRSRWFRLKEHARGE